MPPKQGIRKDDKGEHGKDDLRQGRHGRYEGGRDSDQDRQAKGNEGRDEAAPAPQGKPEGRGRGGAEGAEEEE